uniref:Uncharacterized protein n=1 Tax=Oryza rufipogon TaxID=4529 RepID=A0A0E0RJE9_ORYRU
MRSPVGHRWSSGDAAEARGGGQPVELASRASTSFKSPRGSGSTPARRSSGGGGKPVKLAGRASSSSSAQQHVAGRSTPARARLAANGGTRAKADATAAEPELACRQRRARCRSRAFSHFVSHARKILTTYF